MKICYPLQTQLEDIAKEYGYGYRKSPWQMTPEELSKAKKAASLFVKWVTSEWYLEPVPADLKTGKLLRA